MQRGWEWPTLECDWPKSTVAESGDCCHSPPLPRFHSQSARGSFQQSAPHVLSSIPISKYNKRCLDWRPLENEFFYFQIDDFTKTKKSTWANVFHRNEKEEEEEWKYRSGIDLRPYREWLHGHTASCCRVLIKSVLLQSECKRQETLTA